MLSRVVALAAALAFAAGTAAQAAEIRVLQSGAFKSAMADIKPLFEQATGHKLVLDSDTSGRIAQRIDKGEQTDFIGPLPTALQSYNHLTAGIPASGKQPEAARALIKFLATPAAQAVIKAKGMDPG